MKSVLIANRGEIAVRVIRTLRVMGIKSILIVSEADEHSLAAKLADETVVLPGNTAAETYLDYEKVVSAAVSTKAEGVHPGYGFLSEREEFSQACADAGLIFIGPSAHSMKLLGNKVEAKLLAEKNGVPLVPGFFKPDAPDEDLKKAAQSIGFPILLKAAAGGGGRGMRSVTEMCSFDESLKLAREEALAAFGDGEMMVEKLVEKPRHIEVQMMADAHGQIFALYERECSLQRRRQKVVEESGSPLPGFAENIWPRMREAAIQMLRAASYQGAATVEFLVDEEAGEFYFLEVNARLQVEHPVSEAVSGLDLVRLQVEVAMGQKLQLSPEIRSGDRRGMAGHAIECRIIAEDPSQGFLPSTGKIHLFLPPSGPGIRVDTGFQSGDEVSRYYDSLLSKLIVFGASREEAIERTLAALKDFHILGVRHNIEYLAAALDSPDFRAGHFDVNWLEKTFPDWKPSEELPEGLGALLKGTQSADARPAGRSSVSRVWDESHGFRNAAVRK